MAELDIGAVVPQTSGQSYVVPTETTDGAAEQKETFFYNDKWVEWYGKYKNFAKAKISINSYATWITGQGSTASTRGTILFESITGSGEDSILSVLWNMLVVKKINGRSYAQIIRDSDTGRLLNLKPLDPSSIVTVVNRKGITIRHEQISKTKAPKKVIKVEDMFYLINDRVADDTTGTSVIEALIWNIEAQEEARRMFRRKVKNSGILGVISVDSQDTAEMTALDVQIKKGIEDGTFMKIPKGVLEAENWVSNLNTQEIIQWLNYLDDEFFMMIGIPKVILGGSSENEGDKKMSYLAFEQVYMREINELKADIWNQLAIRIEFNKPASLQNQLADNELKNTSQVGVQPNDTQAGVGE